METPVLDLFLPPVREWFRRTLGEPTPPQKQGWPVIAAGQNTLILSPTGSGKTLAAFLACLDHLWREPQLGRGVHILYVSPLKALNNDIHRNLQEPLEGVVQVAREMGFPLPVIEAGIRTGDTPSAERQRQQRQPPHVLITTPESLHLLLTSRGRETLRGVTHCIVDEIHALCGNKRGVFLSLLMERLEAINRESFVRIGLSATQRPLEEVARYLGGLRPVTIVDAGQRKQLDLRIVSPVDQFGPLPEKSVWPSIYQLLRDEIGRHRSTIVFANDRRGVERITAFLNEPEEIAHAHHGSVSLEVRHETEKALKEGRLPCVVATASLEMGIDMGAVDLVCQVASPGSVSRGLQRVGRAGHLVGQKSKGRLIPRTPMDMLEQAVLAHEMAAGRVEELRVPTGCLDVLAQQVVAMVAMDKWTVPDLFALVRRAYPYRDLSPAAFESVLEMVSGRFRLAALQARISWDRVHNQLHALPGSQQVALVNGGTIPDTGLFMAYTTTGVRIGELDEEFVYERRVGDAFLLGTNAWRVTRIDSDRVEVAPAEGAHAVLPFWRGEGAGRSHELGLAIGRFLRELRGRLDQQGVLGWLEEAYFLEPHSARNLLHHVRKQLDGGGKLPTDQNLAIEASREQLGDWQVILLSPFGSRLHLALRLALEHRLNDRLGYRPQCLHHDDGILVRLTESEEPILDLLQGLTPENVEDHVIAELAESALFALRFRQNAARSLMLPRSKPGQRAPLWLQRLRGRDLLQVARKHADFPVVVETFRECLHDHLDVPRLKQLLLDIQEGRIAIETSQRELPSPFAASIVFSFTASNLYEKDHVAPDRASQPLDREVLGQLLAPEDHRHLLDPRAVHQVERRLRGVGQPPRTVAEMAEWLRRLGDLAPEELEGPMAEFLAQLQTEGRASLLELPGTRQRSRWVLAEELTLYRQAFAMDSGPALEQQEAASMILDRFLRTHALVSLPDILARYPFEAGWAEQQLRLWTETGRAVSVPFVDEENVQWSAPENLEQVQRGSLGLLRREVVTCSPPQLVDFILNWQHVHPGSGRPGAEGLAETLARLTGLPLPASVWEEAVLPARVSDYQPRWLDEWIAGGAGAWIAQGNTEENGALAFLDREEILETALPSSSSDMPLSPEEQRIIDLLRQRGASFVVDLVHAAEMTPSVVRNGLWSLMGRSLVTNDHFDVVRRGRQQPPATTEVRAALRRRAGARPEGRWSLLPWASSTSPEAQAVLMASRLLHRYGIAARELALCDPWMPPWRVLYEVLSRMELTGDVRRGYFAEGLSGSQFALPEACRLLQEQHLPSTATAPAILLHSLDPANLYGASAPLDIPLLDGGTRSFSRRAGNWIVLRAGKPILLVEQHAKKLTALASASREEVEAAVALLPALCQARGNVRHKLTVDEWNGQPVTSTAGRELLEKAGFVRDYLGMTLYAVWR
jgi:ATP-dependent Lhr-like helicase